MKAIKQLINGFEQPFHGLNMIRNEKRLRSYVAIPIAINIAIFLLLFSLLWIFRVDMIDVFYSYPQDGGFWLLSLWYLLAVLLFGFIMVATYFLFTPIGCLIASPFNDALAGRTEQIMDDDIPIADIPFSFKGLPKMLIKESIKLGLAGGVAIIGLLLNLLPVLGSILSIAFYATFGSFVIALEYLDYPMSRYGYSLSAVIETLRTHFWRSMGFGGATLLLLLIPFINLLCIPACVIGGTRLFVDFRKAGTLPKAPVIKRLEGQGE